MYTNKSLHPINCIICGAEILAPKEIFSIRPSSGIVVIKNNLFSGGGKLGEDRIDSHKSSNNYSPEN